MSEKVLALVVTHNRKHLLAECLDLLAAQDRQPDHVLVIGNASDEIFYLEARNRAWLVRSDAFGALGKTFWTLNSLGVFLARLREKGLRGARPIWQGWLEGFRTSPDKQNRF